MKYGFVLPDMEPFRAIEMAREAESHGWDGFFVWELDTPFDIVVEKTSPGDDKIAAADIVAPWAEAGATWWIESMWEEKDPAKWLQRLRQGPPKS